VAAAELDAGEGPAVQGLQYDLGEDGVADAVEAERQLLLVVGARLRLGDEDPEVGPLRLRAAREEGADVDDVAAAALLAATVNARAAVVTSAAIRPRVSVLVMSPPESSGLTSRR